MESELCGIEQIRSRDEGACYDNHAKARIRRQSSGPVACVEAGRDLAVVHAPSGKAGSRSAMARRTAGGDLKVTFTPRPTSLPSLETGARTSSSRGSCLQAPEERHVYSTPAPLPFPSLTGSQSGICRMGSLNSPIDCSVQNPQSSFVIARPLRHRHRAFAEAR